MKVETILDEIDLGAILDLLGPAVYVGPNEPDAGSQQ